MRRSPHPVLVVPGAFTGAWLWEDTFLPYVAARGYDAHAFSFSTHGAGTPAIHGRGLSAYLQDLETVVDALPAPPVMVGYSLGAWVACHFAARRPPAALVLVAPVPPQGMWPLVASVVRRDPVSALKLAGLSLFPPLRFLVSPPRGMISQDVAPERARWCTDRLRAESWRVLAEATVAHPAPPLPPGLAVLAMGFGGDGVVPPALVRDVAARLGAELMLYDGLSHTPSAERGWEVVANDLVTWTDRILAGPRPAGP